MTEPLPPSDPSSMFDDAAAADSHSALPPRVEALLAQLDAGDITWAVAVRALVTASTGADVADGGAPLRVIATLFRDHQLAMAAARGHTAGSSDEHLGEEAVLQLLREQILPGLGSEGIVLLPPGGLAALDAHVRLAPELWESVQRSRDAVLARLRASAIAHSDAFPPPEPVTVPDGSELAAEGLVKVYRGRKVVNDVALRLRQGEIVGLLGPNGAGKTTTFYMIVGLIAPLMGRITLDGEDITRTPMYKRAQRGIGYLAQEPSIFRKLTVEDNILAILETLDLSASERSARLETLLDELKIKHLRRSKAYQLSGGERRRLEITRALVTEPKFMMLDEPFAGVDPKAVDDIQKIVAQLRYRGIGVLISDHNVEQTLDIVDRAYIMYDGQVRVAGTVRDLVFDDNVSEFYLGPTLTARLRARYAASGPEVAAS
jgi:lipopolysaccharide export system ATP-binding protein